MKKRTYFLIGCQLLLGAGLLMLYMGFAVNLPISDSWFPLLLVWVGAGMVLKGIL